MPEMHLNQLRSTYDIPRAFTKNKGKVQKIKEIRDSRFEI